MARMPQGTNPRKAKRPEKPRKRRVHLIPGPTRSRVITREEFERRRRLGMRVAVVTLMATKAQTAPGTLLAIGGG